MMHLKCLNLLTFTGDLNLTFSKVFDHCLLCFNGSLHLNEASSSCRSHFDIMARREEEEVSGQPTTVVSFGFNNLSEIVKLLLHASASALIS